MAMNKIMIVDDMPIFLEYLRGCIDWESYGFEICCEAHDGKEALEMMEKYYPDLIAIIFPCSQKSSPRP